MTQARLNRFLSEVQKINNDFTEKRSSLKSLLVQMRQQVQSDTYNINSLLPLIQTAETDKRGQKYATALQDVRNTWGKPILECKGPHQAAFGNVAARLYVLKTAQVTFREVDTGAQTTHTFSVNSTSNDTAGEVVANLTFGANTHPVRAIVFELSPTITFEDPFGGRSQSDLGVNERIVLGFHTTPAGIAAPQAGNLVWSIVGSVVGAPDRQKTGALQRTKTDASAPNPDGAAYFIAPWATDKTFPTGPRGNPTSTSTLRLTVQNGPSTGMFVEKSFTVHMPVARMVARLTPRRHVTGKPSAGFIGDIYFDPKNVSFKFIQFKEGRGTMVARQTGFKTPANASLTAYAAPKALPTAPSGYFAWEGERVHAHTPIWVSIGTGDSVNGCKLAGSDDVYTAPNPEWPNKYSATYPRLQGKDTDVPSELTWPIYWKYKPTDLAVEVNAQQAKHESKMDKDGTVTTSKAGASVTIAKGAPTVA